MLSFKDFKPRLKSVPSHLPPVAVIDLALAVATQNAGKVEGCAAASVQSQVQAPSCDVAIADWDDLFRAVEDRLRMIAAEPPATGVGSPVQAGVLDCVTALEQLRTTLAHEIGRTHRLELDVFDAQTALAQARAELAGTQAGERRARHLALHDGLTLLPNRGCFRERLDRALEQAQPEGSALAVLYIDLDGFKSINDLHGHAVGDDLLRIVASRLMRALRVADTVGRLGGDEFACMLADLPSRAQLTQLACVLFDAVSATVKIGDLRLTVRPSIGIAMWPDHGTTCDGLLRNADAAMFHAKRHQTGYAFFGSDTAR